MICLVNKSTLLKDADVRLMARACASQVKLHLASAWGLSPIPVVYLSSKDDAPPGAWVLTVLDDSDQADALGWHSEDDSGLYYGRIFARPVFDNGGNALTKSLSVASVGSHEVCEIFCDPACNLYAEMDQHTEIAVEACDPVESDSYVIKVDGISVTVSNFVTRRWFDPLAQGGRFDYLGKVNAPFTMTKGGYVIVKKDGVISQQFGEKYPEWKKATKQHRLARTARRSLQR